MYSRFCKMKKIMIYHNLCLSNMMRHVVGRVVVMSRWWHPLGFGVVVHHFVVCIIVAYEEGDGK